MQSPHLCRRWPAISSLAGLCRLCSCCIRNGRGPCQVCSTRHQLWGGPKAYTLRWEGRPTTPNPDDEDSELLDLISEVDLLISKVVSLITDVVEEVDILLHSKVSPPTLCAFFCIQQTPPYFMHDASIATLDCWGPAMSMMLFIARRLSSISCKDSPSVDFRAINISWHLRVALYLCDCCPHFLFITRESL